MTLNGERYYFLQVKVKAKKSKKKKQLEHQNRLSR